MHDDLPADELHLPVFRNFIVKTPKLQDYEHPVKIIDPSP